MENKLYDLLAWTASCLILLGFAFAAFHLAARVKKATKSVIEEYRSYVFQGICLCWLFGVGIYLTFFGGFFSSRCSSSISVAKPDECYEAPALERIDATNRIAETKKDEANEKKAKQANDKAIEDARKLFE